MRGGEWATLMGKHVCVWICTFTHIHTCTPDDMWVWSPSAPPPQGHLMESVGWNKHLQTDSTTGPILLGTSKGEGVAMVSTDSHYHVGPVNVSPWLLRSV